MNELSKALLAVATCATVITIMFYLYVRATEAMQYEMGNRKSNGQGIAVIHRFPDGTERHISEVSTAAVYGIRTKRSARKAKEGSKWKTILG